MDVITCYDDTSENLTPRLIALMKKNLRLLGDIPQQICVDPATFLDLDIKDITEWEGDAFWDQEHNTVLERNLSDFGLKVTYLQRKNFPYSPDRPRNMFCVMTGKNNIVIGVY